MHLETTPSGVEYHFHLANGDDSDRSPWAGDDTTRLVTWASQLLADFHERMPDLLDDIDEAADWHEAGFDLFVCEVEEPTKLDLIEVDIEGELLTLPWLGSGRVEHEHTEGGEHDADHPIALLWNEHDADPDTAIAEAWLDPAPSSPSRAPCPTSTGPRSAGPKTRCSPGSRASTSTITCCPTRPARSCSAHSSASAASTVPTDGTG